MQHPFHSHWIRSLIAVVRPWPHDFSLPQSTERIFANVSSPVTLYRSASRSFFRLPSNRSFRRQRDDRVVLRLIQRVKVAGLAKPRVSVRISQKELRCLRDDCTTSQAARRCYGTVASSLQDRRARTPIPSSIRDAAHQPKTETPASHANTGSPVPTRGDLKSFIPSVLLPAQAAKSPTVHKIHVLGEDERSKFIAHALSGLYESVEMLGWTPNHRRKMARYKNVQGPSRLRPDAEAFVERNAAIAPGKAEDENSHIDQLVVTGSGCAAATALKSVRHRIDEDTTVCLMNNGLGVLDDVRHKIFSGSKSMPDFLLGHMSHKLAFNRRYDSVRQLRFGQLMMTPPHTTTMRPRDVEGKVEARTNFVKSMESVRDLNSSVAEYDQWLRFKLPSVVFESVVEPVCVVLDVPYHSLLNNPPAERMMHNLLDEIILVLRNLPELEGSVAIRDFVEGNEIRRALYNGIKGKREEPSHLARRLIRGIPTDVEFMNGYFIRRAQRLGIDLKYNTMMRDVVKAKHSIEMEKLNSDVALEETSIPENLGFRYRTARGRIKI